MEVWTGVVGVRSCGFPPRHDNRPTPKRELLEVPHNLHFLCFCSIFPLSVFILHLGHLTFILYLDYRDFLFLYFYSSFRSW